MRSDELVRKPRSLSHPDAAGLPMAGQTAFHALYEEGGLDAGQRVLVHAAAGGVGHLAVQFASNTGAHVVGTASGRNEAYLHELGVDQFVNYRETQFEDEVDDVDVVLDAVGGETLERSVDVVEPGGVVVTLPEPPSERAVERYKHEHDVDVRFFDVVLDSDPVTLRRVAAHAESGAVEPQIGDTYSLSEVQDALERSADGHVRGKLVVDLGDDADD
jgi:NADPH:quinone reductase-like Zn-dependent oxidoreductase